jgi:acyl transferase domain-containing protein
MPLNVPSAVAQKECIQTAYARAGRNITDVDFAELHITGAQHYGIFHSHEIDSYQELR